MKKGQTEGNPISGWYCDCKVGAKTVGCCAHVASVLWYLGYARNHPYTLVPSKNPKIQDAANSYTLE